MSEKMSDKPRIQDLDACLRGVVGNWKRFAFHLPGIDQTELDIIEENKPGNVVAKKLELYKVWLRIYPNASWNDVIKALEAVGENTIAKQLREKYLTKEEHELTVVEPQPEVISPSSSNSSAAVPMSPAGQTSTTEEVLVREEVVTELNTFHQSFLGLTKHVESEVEGKVENGDLTVKSVTRHLKQEQAFPIPSLQSVTTSDELLDAIRPHYNFLNCYLIISIALNLLSKAIAEKATEYREKIGRFMKTTKIRSLHSTLKRYPTMFRERSANTAIVNIVVENGWDTQNLWLVKNLVKRLFAVKHSDELLWCDIVPGSVVMTFIALKHMTPSLIESSREKTEFMRLIGVISLKIGDELVWEKEKNNFFSFEDSLIQATLADNTEAIQFLLQYTQINVNTKNATNTLINVDDEGIHYSQEAVESFLKTDHATFAAILKNVEYEFQYVQGRMTAVDNDDLNNLNGTSPVADSDRKSAHRPRDNFLNGRVLAGLSDQLPEHLSTRVKQYQATIP